MNVRDEILGILRSLREKRRFRDLDGEKLQRLFNESGLAVPERILRRELDPAALLAAWQRREGKPRRLRPWSAVPWILLPAAAAAALVAVALIRFLFFVPDTTGRVLYATGPVQAIGGHGTRTMSVGDTLREGETVHTGDGGKADLAFSDSITLRIGERSDFSTSTVRWGAGSGVFDAMLARGTAIVYAKKCDPGDRIIIRTRSSEALVKGTLFSISAAEDGGSSFRTFEGAIRVRHRIEGWTAMEEGEKSLLRSSIHSTAVTVEEGEYCDVAAISRTGGSDRGDGGPPELAPLTARKIVGSDDELSQEVRDFMGHSADRADLVTGRFLVFPTGAELIIDGTRKAAPERILFLQRGRHDVTIYAPGYETLHENIVAGPDTAFVFALVRQGERGIKSAGRGGDSVLQESGGIRILVGEPGTVKGTLHGIDRWLLHLNSAVHSRPVIDSGSLYLATAGGKLMRIDAADGSIIWNEATGCIDERAGISVRPGGVFVMSGSVLSRRHRDTGNRIWQREIGATATAAPVFFRGTVYVPSSASLVSIDETSGARTGTRVFNAAITSLEADGGRLRLGTAGGGVYTIDAATGDTTSSFEAGDAVASIVPEGSSFMVLTRRGMLIKYGDGAAEPLWRVQTPLDGTAGITRDGRFLSLRDGGNACLYDTSRGVLLWRVVLPRGNAGRLTLRGNRLSFTDTEGNVMTEMF
ncbi:MAG: PQQ-binding-like beta-propeller repeat protein [Spirochaetes bacterium]|nr:PQQ-binding-like beta-propeller repeat protein [Spirochaetota bacterium]